MSLITWEGFDSYADEADLENRWAIERAATGYIPATSILYETGRNGVGKCMVWDEFVNGVMIGVDSLNPVIVGCALYLEGDGTGINTTGYHLFEFWDVAYRHSIVYLDYSTQQLAILTDSELSAPGILASSVQTLNLENWYYIEVQAHVSDSLGTDEYLVKVNGETWISVPAGKDTYNDGGRQSISSVRLGGVPGGGAYRAPRPKWDDLYILDPSVGVAPYDDFLGDSRVDTIRPNGNGFSSDFLGSDADSVDNYLLVDEQAPDYDTTTIESNTPGDLDLYDLESLPVTPSIIFGVQPVSVAKKDDAGDRVAKHVIRTQSTNYIHADGIYASDINYLGFTSKWELNPNTGVAFTETDIDNLQSGITIDS